MDSDLERLVDERLRRLPGPRAPHTLRPRVMAAARQPARRPPARPWFAWPLAWQALFVAALVLSVGGGGWWLSTATAAMGWEAPVWMIGTGARVTEAARDLLAASEAVRVFMRAFLSQPLVLCLVAVVIVMTAACVTFGTLLGRMASFRVQGAE